MQISNPELYCLFVKINCRRERERERERRKKFHYITKVIFSRINDAKAAVRSFKSENMLKGIFIVCKFCPIKISQYFFSKEN
jgi:hypothetical protein